MNLVVNHWHTHMFAVLCASTMPCWVCIVPRYSVRGALRQNVADAFGTPRAARNFVGALFLRVVLPSERGLVGLFRAGQELDATAIDDALSLAYTEHIHSLSQVHSGPGSRIGLYFRDVGTHALGMVPPYYLSRHSHGVLVRFLRFRLGCHHLRVHTGRWAFPVIPHTQRFCLRCSDSHHALVDDEAHCLLRCTHPTLVQHRAHLFGTIHLGSVSTYAAFWALVDSGRLSMHAVVRYIALCVRVCWFCHSSGSGLYPVPLPPVLQAPDSLDMFDSESDFSAELASEDELVEQL